MGGMAGCHGAGWRGRAAAVAVGFAILIAIGSPQSAAALEPAAYAIEKIFYGSGWSTDPAWGNRRQLALLNLTLESSSAYPDNGSFERFSQIFVEFSIPADATGPANGPGLRIRFSYYVSAQCVGLDASSCPIGPNTTATSQDVLELEIQRLLEFHDLDGEGAYDPGEPIARAISYARPESPFAALFPFGDSFTHLVLPFAWNVTGPGTSIALGALFANDTLLDALNGFRITVGDGTPVNLTLDAYLFPRPSTYKGIPLTPDRLKLDLYIGHHSGFAENGTSIALEMRLTSTQHAWSSTSNASAESLSTSSAAASAFFSWDSNATVDGASAGVRSTIVSPNENETLVYLAYPRGEVIWHDPVLGLGPASEGASADDEVPATGGLALWVGLAVAVIALVAIGIWFGRRRSRRLPEQPESDTQDGTPK